MNYNLTILCGNLTRDPEVKYTPAQNAYAKFSIAVNREWKGEDGQKKTETTFVECVTWGPRAEALGKYRKKGNGLFVTGYLRTEAWTDAEGNKKSRLTLNVEDWKFPEPLAKPEEQQSTEEPY
jgi:single-strand DNA-binding protein